MRLITPCMDRERRASGKDSEDMLSRLLAEQGHGEFANQLVADHLLTSLLAGHLVKAMTWTFSLLSAYPAERLQLLEELDTMLVGRRPTLEDILGVPYLEWVIFEEMRLSPTPWVLARRAIDPFELDGVTYPASTMVFFSQWIVHHSPEIWGDAEHFRPERWDPGRDEKAPLSAYFPFGGGPRIAAGMETIPERGQTDRLL